MFRTRTQLISTFLSFGRSSVQIRRGVHTSSCLCRFYESNPRGAYHDVKLEEQYWKEKRDNWYGIKDGFKDFREEVKKWNKEFKESFDDSSHYIYHGDMDVMWKFKTPEDIEKWYCVCDSDHDEGYSKSELKLGPNGKGLFHGFVNTEPPKDGRIKRAGYASIKTKKIFKSFGRENHLDWTGYDALVMRVRGDGRCYLINLSTSGFFDITWNDIYHYILYTRGGPYWQYVKIPFSKFYFASKGRVQDIQERLRADQISSIGFTAAKEDGPFSLEIDYIGVEADHHLTENIAYEMYRTPKFIANTF